MNDAHPNRLYDEERADRHESTGDQSGVIQNGQEEISFSILSELGRRCVTCVERFVVCFKCL